MKPYRLTAVLAGALLLGACAPDANIARDDSTGQIDDPVLAKGDDQRKPRADAGTTVVDAGTGSTAQLAGNYVMHRDPACGGLLNYEDPSRIEATATQVTLSQQGYFGNTFDVFFTGTVGDVIERPPAGFPGALVTRKISAYSADQLTFTSRTFYYDPSLTDEQGLQTTPYSIASLTADGTGGVVYSLRYSDKSGGDCHLVRQP